MRFLIVDDSSFMRARIKQLFSSYPGIQFEEAVNGLEALEKHRSFTPDVIFLDYIMPAPDGLAVLKILRQIDQQVKIVMLTTLGNQKLLYKDCIECGAMAIIAKPITVEHVTKVMKSIQA